MVKQLSKQGLRKCFVCKEIFPLDFEHFYRNNGYGRCGFDMRCRRCNSKRNLQRNKKRLIKDNFKGYVYIIKCEDNYKIGITKHDDIKKRINDMQCGNPYKLELHKMYSSIDMFKSETELHRHFKHKHIRGEWYKLDCNDLVYINTYFI